MKNALLVGSKGNLGPVWMETLRDSMGFDVMTLDPPEFDSRREIRTEIRPTPDVFLYNAAIDNPPNSVATFFGNRKNIMDINLIGCMNVLKDILPSMIRNGGGVVVNVGSIQGRIGADYRNYPEGFEKPVAYNCSKAALEQLSRSIAVQYGRYGIRAVTIAFGPFDNGKFDPDFKARFVRNVPLGRIISRESIAATLRYAIECPELTGTTVLVDGGYTAW